MLKSLNLENFTVFADAQLEFSPGINVIIGENGTGKTHLLKAAYCFSRAWPDLMQKRLPLSPSRAKGYFEERLINLYQPSYLADLIRWGHSQCKLMAAIDAYFPEIFIGTEEEVRARKDQFPFGKFIEPLEWQVVIQRNGEVDSNTNAALDASKVPDAAAVNSFVPKSVFIPSKEIISLYEGLPALLERYAIKLDATYRDLVFSLNSPETVRLPDWYDSVFSVLESALKGVVKLDGNRFVYEAKSGGRVQATMLPEGFCRLALLPYLIRHNIIGQKLEALFLDEPDTNLNPKLISILAQILVGLAKEGIQVIFATHNLFLLKEIDLQLQLAAESNNSVPARFFALSLDGENGVKISAGDELDSVGPIAALDMEIDQADRYQDWYYRVSRAE